MPASPVPTGPIDELAVDDIRRTLDVDLLGQFLVLRLGVPLLRASGDGAIINISSVAGRLGYGSAHALRRRQMGRSSA